jgi:hypothetical protein
MYVTKRLLAALVFFVVEVGAVLVVAIAVAMTRVVAGDATGIGFVAPGWQDLLVLAVLLAPLAWAATWLSRRAVRAPSGSTALL